MTSKDRITLYYSPQTRASGARILLEELGAPYDLHVLNMKAGEQRQVLGMALELPTHAGSEGIGRHVLDALEDAEHRLPVGRTGGRDGETTVAHDHRRHPVRR
jgi:hypothetical protein